jgi:hypothetical protein
MINPWELTTEEKIIIFKKLLDQSIGKEITIDPDAFKHLFSDYREENHKAYSLMSDEYYDFVLNNDTSRKSVLFTAGGSGSGKSEVLIKSSLNEGFRDIIVDGTLAKLESALRDINKALEAGKKVMVKGALPDLEKAYGFVLKRFLETKRPVPMSVFLDKHLGFYETFPLLIKHYKGNPMINFSLTDVRDIDTFITYTNHDDIQAIMNFLEVDVDSLTEKLLDIEKKLGINNPTK